MIKAGALLYAMFLVVVITIISSSFVLVNYQNSSYIIHLLKQDQLQQDARSGINYGLAMHQQLPINLKQEVDIFSDEQHKVVLEKKNWGAFYVLCAQAKWKNKTVAKSTLIGENINEGEKIALYLVDQNSPLSLTGRTSIVGDCYLPKQGVKRAYVEGKSFSGNQLINGLKRNSEKSLPPINQELIQENYLHFSLTNTDSVVDFELLQEKDSIINSFQNKTLVVYSPFSIVLSNKIIEGNVIIKSDQKITIAPTTIINNALFYAGAIIIEKELEGNGQFFAQDSIIVNDDVKLNYPSVLAVIGKGGNTFSRKIEVKENVQIKGSIFLYNEKFDRKNQSLITLGNKSEIIGQVYSSELLKLKGTVNGSVFCRKLTLKTPSSVYENHLTDATINREALSVHFVGVSLTATIKNQQIIKWLN